MTVAELIDVLSTFPLELEVTALGGRIDLSQTEHRIEGVAKVLPRERRAIRNGPAIHRVAVLYGERLDYYRQTEFMAVYERRSMDGSGNTLTQLKSEIVALIESVRACRLDLERLAPPPSEVKP